MDESDEEADQPTFVSTTGLEEVEHSDQAKFMSAPNPVISSGIFTFHLSLTLFNKF